MLLPSALSTLCHPPSSSAIAFGTPGQIRCTDRETEACSNKMTCPNSDQSMADLKPKPSRSLASQAARKESSDKFGVGHGGDGGEPERQARPCRPVQQFGHRDMRMGPLPSPEQSSRSRSGVGIRAQLAVQDRAPPLPVRATAPNLCRELPVNWSQTCLELQRGVVSIFHTGLVIYNSLRNDL